MALDRQNSSVKARQDPPGSGDKVFPGWFSCKHERQTDKPNHFVNRPGDISKSSSLFSKVKLERSMFQMAHKNDEQSVESMQDPFL